MGRADSFKAGQRFGDELKSNTESLVAVAFAREILHVDPERLRRGRRADGEPDVVVSADPLIGIEVSAAIGDDDYSARLSAWLLANPQPVPAHSSSASNEMPVPTPMSARRTTVAHEALRVTQKHMVQPYAEWSYFVINLSQNPIEARDAEWIAATTKMPTGCAFLGVYVCYVVDREFVRRFVQVRAPSHRKSETSSAL